MQRWIYDIETYPDVFTIALTRDDKSEAYAYEISPRKDDSKQIRSLFTRMYREKHQMVGFNNLGFDYPVIHKFMCTRGITAQELYEYAMGVISASDDEKFNYIVPDKKQFVKQIDLYKIHHFDNKARATSLKMLEYNMRSPNIEDLPFPVGSILNDEQIAELVTYNIHDVKETFKFYEESLGAISFREELSEKYGRNFLNHNDTKIGKDYFIMKLEEEMPESCYSYRGGKRTINQTKRKYIDLKDVIFPYVKFERPEFQEVLTWLKKQRITETKGVFSDIVEHELGGLAEYAEMLTKRKKCADQPSEEEVAEFLKEYPKGWIEEKELKSKKVSYYKQWRVAASLNTVVDEFEFVFGTGGIHGSVESQVVESDETFVVVDLDVASYYPNLAISNKVYPKHLSETFCDIYEDVYNQRKSFAKGTPENAMMKLALNGVYGDSNNKFSPFYDPAYTMAITVNGQLLLCMLAEELMKIENLTMIQINTDGLTVKVPREHKHMVDSMAADWEKLTGLELEEAVYSRMFIRDVNNYIAENVGGYLKAKGAYAYEGLGWHQNQSSLVIKMAAEAALVRGEDIEDFIRAHKDPYDFMLRTKVPRSSRLVTIDELDKETPQQNICRYYISTKGERLMKIMPPLPTKPEAGERYIGIDKEWLVRTCNDMNSFKWDIDYDYYISEAEKLVNPLINHT